MNWKTALFALLVILALVVSLYRAKGGARQSAAEIAELEAHIEAALAERELLRAELAHMSRREWLEVYAREELGMSPARASQFVDLAELDARMGAPVPPPDAATKSGEAQE